MQSTKKFLRPLIKFSWSSFSNNNSRWFNFQDSLKLVCLRNKIGFVCLFFSFFLRFRRDVPWRVNQWDGRVLPESSLLARQMDNDALIAALRIIKSKSQNHFSTFHRLNSLSSFRYIRELRWIRRFFLNNAYYMRHNIINYYIIWS